MPTFRKLSDYYKYITNELIKVMDIVGEKARNHMYDYVKKEMESRPENEDVYKRTWEYLNSIDRISATLAPDGSIETMIYYNTDLIEPHITTDGTLYAHADDWGRDVSDMIPLWMETGVSYITSNGYRSHKPVGGIIDLEKWVKLNFKKELIKELKKKGIACK